MIKNIDFHVDWEQMHSDYEEVLLKALPNGWDTSALIEAKQINLRGKDFIGDWDRQMSMEEIYKQYNFWHPETPSYTKNILEELCYTTGYKLTRARYLCLAPGRGLTYHEDMGERIHFVIETNPQSLFFFVGEGKFHESLQPHHLPCSNNFIKVDTTKTHFVYNAGHTNRIHLVIS